MLKKYFFFLSIGFLTVPVFCCCDHIFSPFLGIKHPVSLPQMFQETRPKKDDSLAIPVFPDQEAALCLLNLKTHKKEEKMLTDRVCLKKYAFEIAMMHWNGQGTANELPDYTSARLAFHFVLNNQQAPAMNRLSSFCSLIGMDFMGHGTADGLSIYSAEHQQIILERIKALTSV